MIPSLPSISFRSPLRRPQQPSQGETRPPAPKVRKIQVPYDKANQLNLQEWEKAESILSKGSLQIEGLDRVGRTQWQAERLLDKLENSHQKIFIQPLSEPDSGEIKKLKIHCNQDGLLNKSGLPQEQAAVLKRHEGQSIESFVAQGIENALNIAQHGWNQERATANPAEEKDRLIVYKPDKHWSQQVSSNKKNKRGVTTSSAKALDLFERSPYRTPLPTLMNSPLLNGMYRTPNPGTAEELVHQTAKQVRGRIARGELPKTNLKPEVAKEAAKRVDDIFKELDARDEAHPPQHRIWTPNPRWEKKASASPGVLTEQAGKDYETRLAQTLKEKADAGTGRLQFRPDRLSSALHDKERLVHHRDPLVEDEATGPKKLHTGLEEPALTTDEAEQAFSRPMDKTQAKLERWLEKRPLDEELPEIPEAFRPPVEPSAQKPGNAPETKAATHDSPYQDISERVEKTKTPPKQPEAEAKPKPGWTDFRQALFQKMAEKKKAELEKARQTPLREKNQAALAGRKPKNPELTLPPEEMKAMLSQGGKENSRYISLKNMLLHSAHQHKKPAELLQREQEKQALEDAQLLSGVSSSQDLVKKHSSGQPKLSRAGQEAKQAEKEKAALEEKQAKLEKYRNIPWEDKSAVALQKKGEWIALNAPDTSYNPEEDVKSNFHRLKQDFQQQWAIRHEENPKGIPATFKPGKLSEAKLKNQLDKQEQAGLHSRHQSIQDFPEQVEVDAPDALKTFNIPPEYFALNTIRDNPKKEKAALKAEQRSQKKPFFKTITHKVLNALRLGPSNKTSHAGGSTSHTPEMVPTHATAVPDTLKSAVGQKATSETKTHQKKVGFIDPPVKTKETTNDEVALREMLNLPPEVEVSTSGTTIRPTGKTFSKRPSFQEIRQAQTETGTSSDGIKNQTVSSKKSAAHHTKGKTSGKFNPQAFWQSYREDLRKHREEEKLQKIDAENKKYFSEVFGIENFDDHEAVEAAITKAENEVRQKMERAKDEHRIAERRMSEASARAESMSEIQDFSEVTDAREHYFETEQAKNQAEEDEIPLQVTVRALRRMMATNAAKKTTTAPEIEEDLYPIPPELLQQAKASNSDSMTSPQSKRQVAWPASVLEDVVAHGERKRQEEENLKRIFASDKDDAVIRYIFGANGLNTPASVVRRTTREAAEAEIKAEKARQEYAAAEELRRHADAKAETSDDLQDLENMFQAQEKALHLSRIKDHAVGETIVRNEIKRAAEATLRKTEAVEEERRQQIHAENKKQYAKVLGIHNFDDHDAVEAAITQKERTIQKNLEKAQQKVLGFESDLRDAAVKKDNLKANAQIIRLKKTAEDAKKADDQHFMTQLKHSTAIEEKQQAEHEKRILEEATQGARRMMAMDTAKKTTKTAPEIEEDLYSIPLSKTDTAHNNRSPIHSEHLSHHSSWTERHSSQSVEEQGGLKSTKPLQPNSLLRLINEVDREEKRQGPITLPELLGVSPIRTPSITSSEEEDVRKNQPPIPSIVGSDSSVELAAPRRSDFGNAGFAPKADTARALFQEMRTATEQGKTIQDIRPVINMDAMLQDTILQYEWDEKQGYLKALTKIFTEDIPDQELKSRAKEQASRAHPDTFRPNAPKQEPFWRFDLHGYPQGPLSPKESGSQKNWKAKQAEEAEVSTSKPKEKAKPLTRQESAKKLKQLMETSRMSSGSSSKTARLETVKDDASAATWSDSEIEPR